MGLPDGRGLHSPVTEFDRGTFDPDSSRTDEKAGAHTGVYRAT